MTDRRFIYHAVAFLVVAVWGSTFISTKLLLLGGLSAAQIFTIRFAIAYILLLLLSLWRGIRWFANGWRHELLMAMLGLTGGTLYFLTENNAMNYTTTTNTSLIVSLSPLVATALISLFYKSQRLSRLQTVGSFIAAAGVAVVVMNGHFVLHLSPRGDALAFGAALCWGLYSLLMIPAGKHYDTLFVTRKVFFYGLLFMVPYFLLRPGLGLDVVADNPTLLLHLLFLGCIASMLCFVAWNWVLKRLGAVVTTNYVYFNPVTTIVFAWLVLHEQITIYFLLGTLLILVGMYLADRR